MIWLTTPPQNYRFQDEEIQQHPKRPSHPDAHTTPKLQELATASTLSQQPRNCSLCADGHNIFPCNSCSLYTSCAVVSDT